MTLILAYAGVILAIIAYIAIRLWMFRQAAKDREAEYTANFRVNNFATTKFDTNF